jgi:hypothetical protein
MADVVSDVVKAPKQAFNWASNHVLAFVLVALLLLVLFVAYETRNPGQIREKVQKIPGVGPWATGTRAA